MTDNADPKAHAEIVATVVQNGVAHELDAASFGHYVKASYGNLYCMWTKSFVDYQETHIMRDVLSVLKRDLDAESIYNIDHHEALIRLAPFANHILVKRELLLGALDKKLYERYETMKQSGNFPILNMVNLEWGSAFTCLYGLYDTDERILKGLNGKDILDVGAFIGDTASVFRALCPNSKVYAFEPSSTNYEQMMKHFAMDVEAGHIIPVVKGCGEVPGSIKLSKTMDSPDSRASMFADFNTDISETVEVIRLDDFVNEHKLNVGLIKIDVEGYEIPALRGALETIKNYRPILLIAIYHNAQEFYELKPYLESLNLNYEFKIRRSNLHNPTSELVLLCLPK